jgi:hypothetical protein
MLKVDVTLVVLTVRYGLGFVACRDATRSLTYVGSTCDYDIRQQLMGAMYVCFVVRFHNTHCSLELIWALSRVGIQIGGKHHCCMHRLRGGCGGGRLLREQEPRRSAMYCALWVSCWTDPCTYTACIVYISSTTGWITSKIFVTSCVMLDKANWPSSCANHTAGFRARKAGHENRRGWYKSNQAVAPAVVMGQRPAWCFRGVTNVVVPLYITRHALTPLYVNTTQYSLFLRAISL